MAYARYVSGPLWTILNIQQNTMVDVRGKYYTRRIRTNVKSAIHEIPTLQKSAEWRIYLIALCAFSNSLVIVNPLWSRVELGCARAQETRFRVAPKKKE